MSPSPPAPARVRFLNAEFDPLGYEEAVAWLAARRAGAPFGYVVTPNVDYFVRAEREPELYRSIRDGAALCVCDSRVLSRLARWYGVRLPVAAGSDLTRAVFERVLGDDEPVVVVGGPPGVVGRLGARYPRARVIHCPAPMGLISDVAARAAVAAAAVAAAAGAGPRLRFLVLALGMPQQEMVAQEIAALPGAAGTALCVGASIDFLVGDQRRAPRPVQRAGLEWAWRLLLNPRRLARRYLVDGPAVFPIARRWARARRQAG